ncbi:MAG: hypothetical protein K8R40_13610 [Anaerolineaceae bacterium]|nr:hypothetical protein [Anaerolineaceae bacterium]
MPSGRLNEAIQLAMSGQRQQAKALLIALLKENPKEELAWLWVVDLIDSNEEKVIILERASSLNPDSEMIQEALAHFKEAIAQENQPVPAAFDIHAQYADEVEPERKESPWRWLRWVLIGLIISGIVAGIVFYWPFLQNTLSGSLALLQSPTENQALPSLVTWTPQASATPTITPTPTPELPVGFGTPMPEPAAPITIWDADHLLPFVQMGDGVLLSAAWRPGNLIRAISSRGFDQFDLNTGISNHQSVNANAILQADISKQGEVSAWSTTKNKVFIQPIVSSKMPIELAVEPQRFKQLCLSPDGQLLVLVKESDEIEIWDTKTHQWLSTIMNDYGKVESLAFSGDHSILAAGNQLGVVWFFDPQTGNEINKFYNQEGSIQSIAFSSDDSLLAAGGTAQSVVLFDLEEMRIHHHIYDLEKPVTGVSFSSQDNLLAIGLQNGEILIWDDDQREVIDQFSRHRAAIQELTFNDAGDQLLSRAEDGALLSWQITTGQRIDAFQPNLPGSIFTSAITPNGKLIALAGSDSLIHLFDLASQQEIAALKGHVGSVWHLNISGDGKKMISGGRDGRVQLWSLETYTQIAELGRHSSYVRGVAFSQDGQLAASASADEMIRVWNTTTLEEVHTLVGHTDQVQSVGFSPDGQTLISAADDGTIRIWDLSTGQMTNVIENEGLHPLYAIQTVPDSPWFLAGDSTGKLGYWNSNDKQLLASLPGHTAEINTIAITHDGVLAASGDADGTVFLWQLEEQERLRILEEHNKPIVGLNFSNDALALYSVDRSGLVLRWDMNSMAPAISVNQYTSLLTHAEISHDQSLAAFSSIDQSIIIVDLDRGEIRCQIKNLPASVQALAISPAGSHIAAGLDNGTIMMWNPENGYEELKLANGNFSVTSMIFEPTGRVLLIGRSNHSIERRDIRTGELLETLWGHSDRVESLAFAPNEVTMASGSADGNIFIWDMDDNSVLHRISAHRDNITALQFSIDGRSLYSSSLDGSIRIWQIANAEEINSFQSEIPKHLLENMSAASLTSVSSGEHSLCFWDEIIPDPALCLSNQFGQIQELAFGVDANYLLIIDQDGCIQKLAVAESTAPKTTPTAQALPTQTQQTELGTENVNSEKLPSTLYYLSDESGINQVWRLLANGTLKEQITTEEFPVTSYDVSRNTDHIAYVSNNELILINKQDGNRIVLVSGETSPSTDPAPPLQSQISDIIFSPDGWRIAYRLNGVHIYSILENSNTPLIEDMLKDDQPIRFYHPIFFSPGGTNLYLQVETQSGDSMTVLNSWTGELFAENPVGACCQPALNQEQDAVYFTGRDRFGNAVGLWSIDIWHDVLTELLPFPSDSRDFQINAFPRQASDGTLYFFYAQGEMANNPPLILASAASDGVSLLKIIRADSYSKLTDVLWADNAEFVLISDPENETILYLKTDDVPPILLPIQGTMMRWGD